MEATGVYWIPLFELLNVRLATVISDIVGETGQKIVRAIIAGERDGRVLAKMKNVRIRASEADIEKSLRGYWRPEHLLALGQAMTLFDAYGDQLAACDRQLEAILVALQQDDVSAPGKAHKLARLIYTMLTKDTEYTDQGQDYYEERYRQRVMYHLAQRAEKPGLQLIPIPEEF